MIQKLIVNIATGLNSFMKMRRSVLLFLLFFFVFHTRAMYAADEVVALKNNLLYDAAATPNLQLEIKLARRWTLEVGAGFNPFPLDDKKFPKWRHLSVSVAPRYWFCNAFHKDFISFNAAYAHYNVAGNAYPIAWMYPQIKDSRYRLAGLRGKAIKDYIQRVYPIADSVFVVHNGEESWAELRYGLEKEEFEGRDEVIRIIDKETDLDRREQLIRIHRKGETYRYMQRHLKHILRKLGSITIYCEER